MMQARHFDITEWADYVRNVVPADHQAQMRSHLQAGCSKCEKTYAVLSRFANICMREVAYEVPRVAEQQVKALVALHKAPRRTAFARLMGSLMYDSVNDPQPAG